MIILKAAPITKAQRTDLERHKANLEEAIAAAAQQSSAVLDLRKREASINRKTVTLQRRAAAFDLAAESELTATLKQIERIQHALQEAEATAHGAKTIILQAVQASQESISTICSKTSYEELLDLVAEAMCPFYSEYARARYEARNAPAVNAFVADLLSQKIIGTEGIERLDAVARETLATVEVLITGGQLWQFEGTRPPAKSEKLLAA